MRICSLLPSTTEIVCALGMETSLVGKTHECDYPPEVHHVQVVTKSLIDHTESTSYEIDRHISEAMHSGSGIYAIDDSALTEINPDLILTQELCEVCAVSYSQVEVSVRKLEGDVDVISLEPTTLDGILETIVEIGDAAGAPLEAGELSGSLRKRIDRVSEMTSSSSYKPKVLSLEWLDPPFCGGHWIPEMIQIAGGENLISSEKMPSRKMKLEEIKEANPDVIVMMPCGFDVKRTVSEYNNVLAKNPDWNELKAVKENNVYAVDANSYFSKPSLRTITGIEILAKITHPDVFNDLELPKDSFMKIEI